MKFVLKCVVIIFSIAFLDAVKFRCDYTYTRQGWLKYHEIPMTWSNARLQCEMEGAVLASPTTPEIKSIMLESFCKPEIFTGIHATFSKGHFYTIDGTPFMEIPHEWAAFEPDNKNNAENCIALHSDGKFSDVQCDEPRPYMCHRPHSDVDVNVCGTPDPEYHFENVTKKCYKFHTTPRTFARAHFVCSAEGGHLAIINSEEESMVIAKVFDKYPESKMIGKFYKDVALIGFLTWENSTDWVTVHGQTLKEAGFTTFSTWHPVNFGNNVYCGSVHRNGLLNEIGCEYSYAFICEKNPDYPAVCDDSIRQGVINRTRFCDNDIQNQTKQSESDPNNIDI